MDPQSAAAAGGLLMWLLNGGIVACLVILLGANLGPVFASWLSSKSRAAELAPLEDADIDHDMRPSSETRKYIRVMCSIGADPVKTLEAMDRGEAPAVFMKQLLQARKLPGPVVKEG